MILEKEVILDRIHRTEQGRRSYNMLADQMEKAWKLDPGFKTTREEALLEGREQIVLPTTFNVVHVSQRLMSTSPRINVIPDDPSKQESVEGAELSERWLQAFWKQVNKDKRRNVIGDAIWYNLVFGRFALEVKWIGDSLPPGKKDKVLPISVRALDPRNVGFYDGPYYTEWVYHCYDTSVLEIVRRWPSLKDSPPGSKFRQYWDQVNQATGQNEDVKVHVVDFWYISEEDGLVYNCVLVEDEFAKEPAVTSYPDLPIIVGRGDYGVNVGDEYDGLSILYPLKDIWEADCRLKSQMMTGVLWMYWPMVTLESEEGDAPDIEVGPGKTIPLPSGVKIQIHNQSPNTPLIQNMSDHLDAMQQQTAYPNIMYGQEPGSLQAGYGISMLNDSASGRIKNYVESLEFVLSYANAFVLALVEKKGGKKGIQLSVYDERNRQSMKLKISKDTIKGNYENEVVITPRLPSDDQAKITLGLRMAESGRLSNRTFWDKFLDVQVPSDEEQRIRLEQALQLEPLIPFVSREALMQYYGENGAFSMLYGTELMPEAPVGYHWMQDVPHGRVYLMPDSEMGMGMGMPMDQMGIPPGMPMDQMGMGMGAPGTGMPGLQPDAIQGPMGGNLGAPAMAGMMEPEMLGLPPQGDPALFAQLMGQPLPPGEELNLLGGLPPGGF